jgi:hypothetical protein
VCICVCKAIENLTMYRYDCKYGPLPGPVPPACDTAAIWAPDQVLSTWLCRWLHGDASQILPHRFRQGKYDRLGSAQ